MADNTTLNVATGGDVIASDDIAGVKHQRVKVEFGADGFATDVSAVNPMPVAIITGVALTDAQLRAAVVPVSPNITRGAGIADVNTQRVTLASDGPAVTALTSIDAKTRAAGQALMATSSPVVIASNQSAIPVSGAFFQATQPVSGPATDAQLRTTPLPVSMSNTLALTDTQLRATPVPITMSNTLALTDTQLRATPVPVSGTVSVTANGIISTVNSTSVALAANGVFTGPAEDITEFADVRLLVFADQPSAVDGLQLQQSSNGTNWDSVDAFTLPATTGRPFSVGASARFFRVVYTNGATAQTAFRLQTKLYKAYGKGASVRPQDARSNENDFEEVLGFGMVYNGTSWDRARGDAINGLRTQMTAVTAVTVLSVANTAATLTLPAPAAGQFHYVTRIRITLHNPTITAVAAAATTLSFTSTNLPGALAWTDGNALAAGTSKTVVDEQLENGIKSSAAATATTITAPLAGAGVQSRITAYFYTGP